MADTSDQLDERGSKPPSSDKLPRAHKRCINKECREVMSLATKVGRRSLVLAATGPPLPPAAACRLPAWIKLPPLPAGAAVLQEVQCGTV